MTAVSKAARSGFGLGMTRLDQVFNHESTATEPAEQFFPTMQEFHGVGFPVQESVRCWGQGTGAVVRLTEVIALTDRLYLGLQANRLFMLADVEPTGGGDARDLPINSRDIGHVASAHRLDDKVEPGWQHGKVVHRRLYRV